MSEPTRGAAARVGDIGWWWYAAAMAVYIPAGFFTQSVVLNWVVGPLFPLLVLFVGPTAARWVRTRLGGERELGGA